jgi:hypothetical protein
MQVRENGRTVTFGRSDLLSKYYSVKDEDVELKHLYYTVGSLLGREKVYYVHGENWRLLKENPSAQKKIKIRAINHMIPVADFKEAIEADRSVKSRFEILDIR